jgi:hypothetical protein
MGAYPCAPPQRLISFSVYPERPNPSAPTITRSVLADLGEMDRGWDVWLQG